MPISSSGCPVCGSTTEQVALTDRCDLGLYQCNKCSLAYQAKSYPITQIIEMYNGDYYNYWGAEQNFDDLRTMKLKTCLAYLDILLPYRYPDQLLPRLLDIGCAHGFMLEAAQQKGFEAFGVEISPAASVAKERGFMVYNQFLHELDLPVESFNVVTILDVLEHIPDPYKFMGEVYRILKPNGVVFIVTPNIKNWVATLMKGNWPHYKQEHLTYFTPKSLSTLLDSTNFEVKYIKPGFKYLSFNYILGHFQKYTPGWMTTTLKYFYALLPTPLTKKPLYLPTEMIVIACRGHNLRREQF